MGEFSDVVMIALLPKETAWAGSQKLLHMTLVYAGNIQELAPYEHNEMLKKAMMIAATTRPLVLQTMRVETLGEAADAVDAVIVNPSGDLVSLSKECRPWNASQYRDWVAHITVGKSGTFKGTLPTTLTFDRILVAWGEQHTIYPLKGV